jgi:hypothetical protein
LHTKKLLNSAINSSSAYFFEPNPPERSRFKRFSAPVQ